MSKYFVWYLYDGEMTEFDVWQLAVGNGGR